MRLVVGRTIGFLFLFGITLLTSSQEKWNYLHSSEITLFDLFDDGTQTYDAKDLFRFASLWMQPASGSEEGDLNGDGIVDLNDLLPLANAFYYGLSPISTSNPEATPTPEENETPTPEENVTPTFDPNTTPSPTVLLTETNTPTSTPDNSLTPTSTRTPTTTPSPSEELTPTSTTPAVDATITSTPTPTATASSTPIPLVSPTHTLYPTPSENQPSPTPAPTLTGDETATPTPELGPTNTPTPFPTTGNNPSGNETPTAYQPEFVRLWDIHPSFQLFSEPVKIPPSGGYASSQEGYAVAAQTFNNEFVFISFDRYGRIFNRTLPISMPDYSGISLCDGGTAFGKFFESPRETRRYRFEPFTMENVAGTTIPVEHLSADTIAWAFSGSEWGSVMAVLRYPNTIALHRIGADGQYLGLTEQSVKSGLPTHPGIMTTALSGDAIAVVYSNNLNPDGSSAPIVAWIFTLSGTLLTPSPLVFSDNPSIDRVIGDGLNTFYIVTKSIYGTRLNRFSKDGILLNRIFPNQSFVDIQYQDGLIWLLDGQYNTMTGFNENGQLSNGPVTIFPPAWTQAPTWLRLKKSGTDLGAFFTDSNEKKSIYYMQIEAGDLATPTPLPASGVPTGVTITIEIAENIQIDMVKIARGTYQRGSPDSEKGRRPNEGPQHSVTITSDFFISVSEITNRQYKAFNPGKRPPVFSDLDLGLDDLPVVGVSWEDAYEFCEWLSHKLEYTFSLPTEAEWEYAARAGTITRRPWGQDLDDTELCSHANVADIQAASAFSFLSSTSFAPCNDGFAGPAPVRSYPPNAFGLHDMLGNVREWCLDWFEKYSTNTLTDPGGPERGSSRIIRGGSWYHSPDFARCAYRSGAPSNTTDINLGFRIVIRED